MCTKIQNITVKFSFRYANQIMAGDQVLVLSTYGETQVTVIIVSTFIGQGNSVLSDFIRDSYMYVHIQ